MREFYSTIRGGTLEVKKTGPLTVEFQNAVLSPGQLATGDYHVRYFMDGESALGMRVRRQEVGDGREASRGERRLIVGNTASQVTIRPDQPFEQPPEPGTVIAIQVRLQRPEVDVKRCIGCGICEHECPVSGRRAIRVTAENESRSKTHSLLL